MCLMKRKLLDTKMTEARFIEYAGKLLRTGADFGWVPKTSKRFSCPAPDWPEVKAGSAARPGGPKGPAGLKVKAGCALRP